MNVKKVGEGNVVLLAGGGKIFTDIAARFCRTEKSLEEIIATEYDKNIVSNILSSGHLAATEFDYFIFGVEGFARVTEIQLVRKRLASYLIKSGRVDKHGKRSYDVVVPEDIMDVSCSVNVNWDDVTIDGELLSNILITENPSRFKISNPPTISLDINTLDLLSFCESWYNAGIDSNHKEENLRYIKPQATEFKALIGMNAHSLLDWWMIRLCMNAQTEIRDLAQKTHKLACAAAPDLFKGSGPSCVRLGYCPENARQNEKCAGKILTKEVALNVLQDYMTLQKYSKK